MTEDIVWFARLEAVTELLESNAIMCLELTVRLRRAEVSRGVARHLPLLKRRKIIGPIFNSLMGRLAESGELEADLLREQMNRRLLTSTWRNLHGKVHG